MQVKLTSSPFAEGVTLQRQLVDLLSDVGNTELTMMVAWAKMSGIRLLEPWLRPFAARGSLEVFVGIDSGGASAEGLLRLLSMTDETYIVYDPRGGTFHPKAFRFRGPNKADLLTGSGNLTAGGLLRNYEMGTLVSMVDGDDQSLVDSFDAYREILRAEPTTVKLTADLVEDLVASGLVPTEAQTAAERRVAAGQNPFTDSLPFGTSRTLHASRVTPPTVLPISRDIDIQAGEEHLLWFRSLAAPSNSGQPNPGSNTTGALRLTKAGSTLDQTEWFRNVLLAGLDWEVLQPVTRPTREWATAKLPVYVGGELVEEREFRFSHDPTREAGQGNFTTDMKWGAFSSDLPSITPSYPWVVLELLDGVLRLRFEEAEPVGFSL